jgi:hypothetical protein
MTLRLGAVGVLSVLWPLLAHAGIVAQFPGGTLTLLAHHYGAARSGMRGTLPLGVYPLPPAEEYVLDYWLQYHAGWIEGQGGKLLALRGGTVPREGCAPQHPAQWNARIMWGVMQAYIYDQDRRNRCGNEEPFEPRVLAVGSWHRITQRVRVNTPNQYNGVFQIWINGQQAYLRSNLRWRGQVAADVARVERVVIQPFRGGDTPAWAVARDTTMEFSPITVLDCVPAFERGSPTTAPRCAAGETAPTAAPPAPRHLRMLQLQ